MCILLKLHYAKFDVSGLFYSKVIEEKPLGVGSTPPLGKGRVKLCTKTCFKRFDQRDNFSQLELIINGLPFVFHMRESHHLSGGFKIQVIPGNLQKYVSTNRSLL